jgi:Tol biopolymer transport system component
MIRRSTFAVFAALCLLGAAPAAFAPLPVQKGERLQDPTITPDGRILYLTIAGRSRTVVVELHRDATQAWKLAGNAPFSGTWRDLEEVLTPDGTAMVFASNRPLPGGTKPLDAYYNGKFGAGLGGNIWIVHRTASGWGDPRPFPAGINANTSVFSPAIASDGTLYFMRASGKQGRFHIFVSSPPYRTSKLAPFASAVSAEFDPTVTSDGSTVVFSSTRAPLPKGTSHLFVTYRHGSSWTTPRDLGAAINGITPHNIEARILPDRFCWNSTLTLYCMQKTQAM